MDIFKDHNSYLIPLLRTLRPSAFLVFIALSVSTVLAFGQTNDSKISKVEGFGATREVQNPDLETNLEEDFKVVFDVSKAPEDPSEVNKWINTVARFVNMHLDAGKPAETLHPVLVLHGNASYGLLKNEFYKEKYGVDNPNIALIQALDEAGVTIYLCGQTAVSRNISEERRIPKVQTALSAMTVLIQLHNRGYQLINF